MNQLVSERQFVVECRRLVRADDDKSLLARLIEPEDGPALVSPSDVDDIFVGTDQKQRLVLGVVKRLPPFGRVTPDVVELLVERLAGDEFDLDVLFEAESPEQLDAGHRSGDDGFGLTVVEAVLGVELEGVVVPVTVVVPEVILTRWVGSFGHTRLVADGTAGKHQHCDERDRGYRPSGHYT